MEEIDEFENYLETSKLSKIEENESKAKGLYQMARDDSEIIRKEGVNERNASFIFKNSYEVIRSAINAHMALNGFNPYSHTTVIAYSRDRLGLPGNKVSKLNTFRKLRNNIRYRAEEATVEEADKVIDLMEEIVEVVGQSSEEFEI